jgi:hypothetical protein
MTSILIRQAIALVYQSRGRHDGHHGDRDHH